MTTLLTIATNSTAVSEHIPKVGYVKAIDVWNAFCTAQVILAFLEFPLVNYIARRKRTTTSAQESIFKRLGFSSFYPPRPKPFLSKTKIIQVMSQKTPVTSLTEAAEKVMKAKKLSEQIDEVNAHLPPVIDNEKSEEEDLLEKKIDCWCRWLFPLSFFIFNLVYWIIYV